MLSRGTMSAPASLSGCSRSIPAFIFSIIPGHFADSFNGVSLALAGFPCVRDGIRTDFPRVMEQTGWREAPADISLLCMHQCVEGATVGPNDFTFRNGDDVIRAADIPEGLTAVLSGHIHRFQVLTRDLKGHPLRAPVLYPGSVERTSFAEKDEKKGYLVLELDSGSPGKPALRWKFHELPARPMVYGEPRNRGNDRSGYHAKAAKPPGGNSGKQRGEDYGSGRTR